MELKPGYEDKVYVPSRRIPHQLRGWLKNHLEEMVKSDILEKSEGSFCNSPIFLVPKPNNRGYRVVNDFRLLNQGLKHNRYPIPHIKDYLDQLAGSEFFSSIDLRQGFYNVVLSPESRSLTAFNVCGDTLQFRRLAMGIKTSPSLFQRIMAKVTGDLLNKRAACYLDDLLAFDKIEDRAIETIQLLLERFREEGFKLNPEKCTFDKKEITFLGYSITKEGWKPTEDKVKAIMQIQKPETVKAMRSFNGMVNYFYQNIPNLQVRMNPLYQLTAVPKGTKSKDAVVEWNKEAEQAFEQLRKSLTETARNAFYSSEVDDKLFLSTDSSLKGYGVVLSQYQHKLGREVPLGYCSEVMTLPDLLSRSFRESPSKCPDIAAIDRRDVQPRENNGVALQAELWFRMWRSAGLRIFELIAAQEADQNLTNLTEAYKQLRGKHFTRYNQDGVKCVQLDDRHLVVIPESLVDEVLQHMHLPQHYGMTILKKLLRAKFWIPNLTARVHEFVSGCQSCQQVKAKAMVPPIPVKQTSTPHPWMSVHAGLVGPMPKSYNNNQYILVCIDNLTRFVDVEALPNKTAEAVMAGFMKIIVRRGAPASLLCDNGKEFSNAALKEMMARLGVHLQHFTPLQPQTNGVCERVNQKLKRCFKIWGAEAINWEDYLHMSAFLINKEYHTVLKTSPWRAYHGWDHANGDVVNPSEVMMESTGIKCSQYAVKHIQQMNRALASIYENDCNQKVERYQKLREARGNRDPAVGQFKPGDRV